MRAVIEFLKSTIVGGLLIILPLALVVLILIKVVAMLSKVSEPLSELLPERYRYPLILSGALLLFFAFILGLLALTRVGKSVGSFFETTALSRIPGYQMMRTLTQGFSQAEENFGAAFVEIEDALVVAFVIEEHDDGNYTVFVPSAPTPMAGAVYVMEPGRVHFIDAPFIEAVRSVSKFGVGSAKLLKSLRQPLQTAAVEKVS